MFIYSAKYFNPLFSHLFAKLYFQECTLYIITQCIVKILKLTFFFQSSINKIFIENHSAIVC